MEFYLIYNASNYVCFPPAFKNWHAIFENGFSTETPNPTNEFVAKVLWKNTLWKTPYSMGIVVKAGR